MACAQMPRSRQKAPHPPAILGGMIATRVWNGAALAVALVLAGATTGGTDGADASAAPSRWQWPISPPGAVVRPFEAPSGPYSAGHRGIDLAAARGQAVSAPAAGVIGFAGVVVDRPVVTIDVGDGTLVSMEPVATQLRVGASVSAGETIGAVASGGHCDGSCLHLGVRVHGAYVSPVLFLAGIPPAVLLPLN